MEARISAPVQTGSRAHLAFCKLVLGLFPGVKQPGRSVDHPPTSGAQFRGRLELCLYSPSGLHYLLPLLFHSNTKYGDVSKSVSNPLLRQFSLLSIFHPYPEDASVTCVFNITQHIHIFPRKCVWLTIKSLLLLINLTYLHTSTYTPFSSNK